ncbi:MAG: hypothetical protein ACQCN6_02105 [Candidatus Bathyarchaeia archaeon]|jgi:hypothetical protein
MENTDSSNAASKNDSPHVAINRKIIVRILVITPRMAAINTIFKRWVGDEKIESSALAIIKP